MLHGIMNCETCCVYPRPWSWTTIGCCVLPSEMEATDLSDVAAVTVQTGGTKIPMCSSGYQQAARGTAKLERGFT